jgi:hypothetical protein
MHGDARYTQTKEAEVRRQGLRLTSSDIVTAPSMQCYLLGSPKSRLSSLRQLAIYSLENEQVGCCSGQDDDRPGAAGRKSRHSRHSSTAVRGQDTAIVSCRIGSCSPATRKHIRERSFHAASALGVTLVSPGMQYRRIVLRCTARQETPTDIKGRRRSVLLHSRLHSVKKLSVSPWLSRTTTLNLQSP